MIRKETLFSDEIFLELSFCAFKDTPPEIEQQQQTLPHKLHSAQYKSPTDRETPGPIASLRFQPIDCELCDIWKINVFLTFREAIERNPEKEKCCLTNLIQRKRCPQQVLNVSSVQRLPEASRLPSNFVTRSISQKEMWN